MDMRETSSGNPTATENYDDTVSRYNMYWEDAEVLVIWDRKTNKCIWNSKVDEAAANLINAFGITIPDNPYNLPTTYDVYNVFVVDVSDDEYRSHEDGPFWNREDAVKYAEGNPGWYGARSTVRAKTLRIYGKRP